MKEEKQAYRLMSEAFLLNKLSHPNIIKVVDIYKTNYDAFCSVMEYSKCYTLKELVEKCRQISHEEPKFACQMYEEHKGELFLKENAILNIVGQILSAFLFLNSQETKIVHRDIKDKNVILWIANKQIKILDFGLARDIDSSDS